MRLAIICSAIICASTSAFAQDPFPAGDGHDLVAKNCTQCHGADVITNSGKTREDWTATVSTMIGMGAAIPESETTKVVDYLAKSFPPR